MVAVNGADGERFLDNECDRIVAVDQCQGNGGTDHGNRLNESDYFGDIDELLPNLPKLENDDGVSVLSGEFDKCSISERKAITYYDDGRFSKMGKDGSIIHGMGTKYEYDGIRGSGANSVNENAFKVDRVVKEEADNKKKKKDKKKGKKDKKGTLYSIYSSYTFIYSSYTIHIRFIYVSYTSHIHLIYIKR